MRKTIHFFGIVIMLLCLASFSFKDDFLKLLERKLTAYYQNNIPVRIHLFFNQPEYAPGDTAYFKLTFLKTADNAPVLGRQIINVNILDRKGNIIDFQQVTAKDGIGHNQIVISQSWVPGIYTVTAYSDWMKNQDEAHFFYTDFIISGENNFGAQPSANLKIYPEGGKLIEGVANKVVVQGSPGDSMVIINSEDTEVEKYDLDKYGLGSFFITPVQGTKYFAVLNGPRKIQLPLAAQKGIAMHVQPDESDNTLKISFRKTSEVAAADDYFFVITNHAEIYYSGKVYFRKEDVYSISIPQEELGRGVLLATLFKADQSVVAERILFVEPNSKVNANITLDKTTYNIREKVTVNIQVSDAQGKPVKAILGATVFSADLFPHDKVRKSLKNFLSFDSEIPFGGIENYSDSMDKPTLDNFLITKKWLQFSWDDVMQEKMKKDIPFKKSLHLQGQVVSLNSEQELPDSTVITFFLQKDVTTYKAYIGKDGKFDFPMLFDIAGNDEVYYRIESKGKTVSDATVIMPTDKFEFDSPLFTKSEVKNDYNFFATQKRIIEASFGATNLVRSRPKPPNPHAWIEEEVFGPDIEVKMRDYVLFPTMEEMIREIVPYVQLRKVNQQTEVRVFISDIKVLAQGPPLYFIDGVITDDNQYFMNLKPEDITIIKALNTNRKLLTFGTMGKNGIILVETSIPKNAQNVPRSKNSFKIKGLNPKLNFKQVDHSRTADSKIPDFRSTLYWNPEISTDDSGNATISFYSADNTGRFKIQLDGITNTGEPFFTEQTFEVKFNRSNSN